MNTRSLDKVVDVILEAGGNGGNNTVQLPNAILAGIAVFDDEGNTPKNTRIEILKNSNPVVESRHISAFRRASGGGSYLGQVKPLWIECDGPYDIRATHDDENLAADHVLQVELIVIPKEDIHLYKR
ncbi:hypothetical protein [Nonlabens xiamenensis]|uniref:hypothetical protein n=1 Tax=Nonlabens xiamenensis TaxID=2341043 RepID=UPI000F604C2D|nr:hypothetical protein [Nonlabens xiamenensis]